MAVPKHLRFFTLFVNGENEVGKVTSVTPPKLTRKTESYRGGGMMGAVSIDLGLDDSALDASFVMGGAVRELFLKYGGTIDGTLLRFAGEYYTDAESDLYEIEMRGRVTEIDMGEAKQGEATSHTYAVKNTYYKLSVNDRPLWEIDLLNHIYRKNGKDIVPDRIRSALGLG
ncbi:phage major tail tube protein [Escherichia coli]|nr:phage major tail tube protein [Escherichia coli]QMP74516.1 phage major tail tube protein [Escherichia coli]QMQ00405.1 phage major tail tube protein [Escherichia coli]QMQ05257.1 phage major tail tube protein [Escherichia coli]